MKTHPDYQAPAVNSARDDFWRQVRRTVGGEPVSEQQIDLIVGAILEGLKFEPHNSLLDLACGNGALTARLYPHCESSVGVDSSEYLISVAEQFFAARPSRGFVLDDLVHFTSESHNPNNFDKVLCYGSFAYLSDHDAEEALTNITKRFTNVSRVFLGNLPDLDRIDHFYRVGVPSQTVLEDPMSPIGVWRTRSYFTRLALELGWRSVVSVMPEAFFAADYRFDVTLSRGD